MGEVTAISSLRCLVGLFLRDGEFLATAILVFVFLHWLTHSFCIGNNDFALNWIQTFLSCEVLVRMELQTLHIDQFLDDWDLVE